MANKNSLSNVLTFRVKQLNECCEKFKGTLDGYVGQIAESARMWIERSEDFDQQEYLDLTVRLEQAIMWFIEATTKINNQSLLERLDTSENVIDMVQELKTDLNSCKNLMDSEVQTIGSNLQKVQKEFDIYNTKQFLRLQVFEKKLSKMEQTLGKTDSQINETPFVNAFKECFGSSSEPKDQSPAVKKKSENKKEPCKTLPDGLSKPSDRLSLPETASDNIDGTVKMIEKKLAELVTPIELMKAQIALEIDEREKGSNHIKAFQERLSALVLDISDLKEHKLGTDERAQSVKDMCQAFVEVSNGESSLSLSSQASSAEYDESRSEKKWTGFCAQCLHDISPALPSGQIPWNILNLGAGGGFDTKTGVFTAPVDGMYLVIFVHFQTGSKPISIMLYSEKAGFREKLVIETRTKKKGHYDFDHCHVNMCPGDKLFLSLPRKDCCYQIPFFSCVTVE